MEPIRKKKESFGRLLRRLCAVISALLLVTALPLGIAATEGEDFKYEGLTLCPGGCAFGVKFSTKGVLVVSLSEIKGLAPAKDAGIHPKDLLLKIDGQEVNKVKEVAALVTASEGRPMTVVLEREGKEKTVTLTAVKDEAGQYTAGMLLRDSSAGIGTVTYVDTESGLFGGLGHGICDIDTGVLMPLARGSAMKVRVGGVVKGLAGHPGEIKGYFLAERNGSVFSNTDWGVFGAFSSLPEGISDPLPVASRYEVKEGKAEIISTLGDDGPKHYEIEITKIDREGTDNKNFAITVTDARLKERAGGIVQGMSGSPIIQNGKLIGAVTHVLVSDPTKGYGIFIENMLDAAKSIQENE